VVEVFCVAFAAPVAAVRVDAVEDHVAVELAAGDGGVGVFV